MRSRWAAVAVIGCVAAGACATEKRAAERSDGRVDAAVEQPTCDVDGDWDDDGIANGLEGCEQDRDSDCDGAPDWQDYDADDDGISDRIEAGDRSRGGVWPRDTDGDGVADFLDRDSDGDGLEDRDEDINGDGLLGCCLRACGAPDGAQDSCGFTGCGDVLPGGHRVQPGEEGCGPGQRCAGGLCTPAERFACSGGETDPLRPDTFGDGVLDRDRGTHICLDAPGGRKPIQRAQGSEGEWAIAIERDAEYRDVALSEPAPKEAAGTIDHTDAAVEVAGFIVSYAPTGDTVEQEQARILGVLERDPPGGAGALATRAPGTRATSHDGYHQVRGTILDLALASPTDVAAVRDALIARLLGRPTAQLGGLPSRFGASSSELVIRFVTLKRFEFDKDEMTGKLVLDAEGHPVDSGDRSQWRVLVMGAVARRELYEDPARSTGWIVDDLASGTALATPAHSVRYRCDAHELLAPASSVPFTRASAVPFRYIPISASLVVGVDASEVPRGRGSGFDYDAAENAVALHEPTTGALLVSYARWMLGCGGLPRPREYGCPNGP